MDGHIRLGRWLPFRAVQVLAPSDGFVWAARAGWGPLSFYGYDSYGGRSNRNALAPGWRAPVPARQRTGH
jgi:hypothetical protein